MQAAQNIFARTRMIVLDENGVEAGLLLPLLLVKALEEKATLIAKDLGFDKQDIGNAAGLYLHERSPYIC
jgi:hypothetical protein